LNNRLDIVFLNYPDRARDDGLTAYRLPLTVHHFTLPNYSPKRKAKLYQPPPFSLENPTEPFETFISLEVHYRRTTPVGVADAANQRPECSRTEDRSVRQRTERFWATPYIFRFGAQR